MTTFATLPLAAIASSLTNPRKTFNPSKLAELAESIKSSGVHQAILVRPLPGSRVEETSHEAPPPDSEKLYGHVAWLTRKKAVLPTHEIVSGERRYRASQMAGLDTIPAMIRELTDDQVLEIQLVENLQRDDLTELEEAEGYEALMQHSSINADQVGGKIGKSRSYVYSRLKLLDLSQESKQALRDGKIDASRALLIARIPDSKLQIKALAYATKPEWNNELPSVRSLQSWLKSNVMLRLENAIFKVTDVRLVEAAGSCADCPKRTGANPDLFTDVDSADICTDPACFHGKEEAHRAALVKKAENKGLRIVQDKEALEMIDGSNWREKPLGYTDLNAKRPDLSQEGERPITLAQALGKDAPAPILFIHPRTQEVSELVPSDEAEAVLLAKGLIKVQERRESDLKDLNRDLNRLQEQAKHATDRAVQEAQYKAVSDAIHQTPTGTAQRLLTGDVLRASLLCELDDYGGEELLAKCARYEFADGVDEVDAITAHIQRMGDTDLLRTMAHFLLDHAEVISNQPENPVATALAKLLGVDVKAVERKAIASVKGEYAAQIKAVQAQIDAQTKPESKPESTSGAYKGPDKFYRGPMGECWSGRGLQPKWVKVHLEEGGTLEELLQVPLPLTPAAQAQGVGKAKKPKTTAAQAQALIAAALQEAQGSTPGADAQGIEADSSQPVATSTPPVASAPVVAGVALAVDARVVVTSDLDKLPVHHHKWAGKEGVIQQKLGAGAWMVSFRGRKGGLASLDGAELTVVPA